MHYKREKSIISLKLRIAQKKTHVYKNFDQNIGDIFRQILFLMFLVDKTWSVKHLKNVNTIITKIDYISKTKSRTKKNNGCK